eukprot:TRINITY_DN26152_c0_g1_i2.p1 TRINITY_DN26152_c0_g1~~TRINITY_DN26152_c0_g1_i2.p1  ORF type:complete len:104 (+),score=5.73 TRINITY_DN26152_c0_g1_i2:133-444(+)
MKKLQYAKRVCLVPSHLVRLFKQPKFYLGMVISVPCGLLGAAIKYLELDTEGMLLHGVINDNAAYRIEELSCSRTLRRLSVRHKHREDVVVKSRLKIHLDYGR